MVLDVAKLSTQHYKVKWIILGMELRPPLNISAVAIEKGAFWSPSTKVADFTFYLYRNTCNRFSANKWNLKLV